MMTSVSKHVVRNVLASSTRWLAKSTNGASACAGGEFSTARRGMSAAAAAAGASSSSSSSEAAKRVVDGNRHDAAAYEGKTPPHGGDRLVDRMVYNSADRSALIGRCDVTLPLSDRNACDVELLVNGGFTPLTGFMNQDVYESVLENMRLSENGPLFGLPVVMDTDRDDVREGMTVLLEYQNEPMAVMEVESVFTPSKAREALKCYGTSSLEHPGALMIATERGKTYIGGSVHGVGVPTRPFPCRTPQEVRASLPANTDVVAFQCRNPVHRAHFELFTRALFADNVGEGAVCLVHPTVGPTQDDDIPGDVRYQTYVRLAEEVADSHPNVLWDYLPYSMHMAGPREAIQHMIMRKNYGCTHFIIGRDMAGSKSSVTGEDFYGAYDAQDTANANAEELGIKTVPSLNVVYTAEMGYVTADKAKDAGIKPLKLSGTEFRRKLRAGEEIPEWFAFKSVVEVLRKHQK